MGVAVGTAVATILCTREGHPPAAQLLVYPVTDDDPETPSQEAFADDPFLSRADRRAFSSHLLTGSGCTGRDPRVSPLRATDLAGVAPAFILTAEADVLRDEGEAYADALRDAGVPVELLRWPGVIHGFWRWQAATSVARVAVEAVAERVKAAAPG